MFGQQLDRVLPERLVPRDNGTDANHGFDRSNGSQFPSTFEQINCLAAQRAYHTRCEPDVFYPPDHNVLPPTRARKQSGFPNQHSIFETT